MRPLLVILGFLISTSLFSQKSFEGLKGINGTNLYLRIEGQGVPLLIIHGGPGLNHSYFTPYLDELATSFTLIYYDQRSSGRSAIPSPDSISLKFFVKDIEAIREMIQAEKINILAHSWGSIPATQYCLTHPYHVSKLILSNPAPLSKEYDIEMAQFVASHMSKDDSLRRAQIISSRDFSVQNMTTLMKINFRSSAYSKENIDKLNINLPPDLDIANKALYTGLANDLASYNLYDLVKGLNFPVLIIEGKYDGIPAKSIARLSEIIPGSRRVVFKKSGHFPFLEETGRYTQVVRSFMTKGD